MRIPIYTNIYRCSNYLLSLFCIDVYCIVQVFSENEEVVDSKYCRVASTLMLSMSGAFDSEKEACLSSCR